MAALYQRSLHLRTAQHPWLSEARGQAGVGIDVAPLRAALAQREATDAAAAGGDLLQTFLDLLAGMVGDDLTERLLRPVWADLRGDAPGEDEPR